jgi:outer membrane biosynthesis protein TonB
LLREGDYGLLSFGSATVFFQTLERVRGEVPRRDYRDGALIACLGLSIFSHVVGLLFLFLVAAEELAPVAALELDSGLLTKMMMEPPPEDPSVLARKKQEDGKVAPGQRDRDEVGGKRAEKEAGRLGKRDAAQTRTEIAGAAGGAVAAQVRGLGLLGALNGGKGDAMARALDMPSLNNLLSGMGSAQTVIGQGSGGLSLRGAGSGGGGTATGVAYGAGELGTAVAGGKGLGRGAQGLGPKGREVREVSLSLDSAAARVSGGLSREQIDRVVRANRAAIKYCFESALQQKPRLQGAVHVQWRIDRKGNVSTTRVEKSTLSDAKVEGCIVRQIQRWKFPLSDGGEVDVVYPFIFRGQ